MIVIFFGGAQGQVRQHQKHKQSQNQCARSAHQVNKTERVGKCPHSTFIYEAAFDFRF